MDKTVGRQAGRKMTPLRVDLEMVLINSPGLPGTKKNAAAAGDPSGEEEDAAHRCNSILVRGGYCKAAVGCRPMGNREFKTLKRGLPITVNKKKVPRPCVPCERGDFFPGCL